MSAIKERPILFSGPMVRAILEGRKTVTRREMKVQPHEGASVTVERFNTTVTDRHGNQDAGPEVFGAWWTDGQCSLICPYGQPGERLWVRESFTDLRGTGIEHRPDPAGPLQRYAFAADSPPGSYSDDARKDFGVKWKPSIHMPRAACRILLEITAVRVERLQDISTEQIIAEGLSTTLREHDAEVDLRKQWRELWELTGGDWESNPWVWVVEFKRIEQ